MACILWINDGFIPRAGGSQFYESNALGAKQNRKLSGACVSDAGLTCPRKTPSYDGKYIGTRGGSLKAVLDECNTSSDHLNIRGNRP